MKPAGPPVLLRAVMGAVVVLVVAQVLAHSVRRDGSMNQTDVPPVTAYSRPIVPNEAATFPLLAVDPTGFVRFTDDAGAERRRDALVDAIWPAGLPPGRPIDPTVIEPASDLRGFAIVALGHDDRRPIGAIDALLANGFAVAIVAMPPDDHDAMFRERGAAALQDFLAPSIEVLNEFESRDPAQPIVMLGLSGGAWTTHLIAAIDTRVSASFAVAGSLPLFARPYSEDSWGDAEQYWPTIFGEADTVGDGVPDSPTGAASWLEIYALGSLPTGRRAVQILIRQDTCCFSGDSYLSYSGWMERTFAGWSVLSDRTVRGHEISDWAIAQIVARLPD